MAKQLQIQPEKCIGCKSCEMACSLSNDKVMLSARSRIHMLTFLEGKYDLPYNYVWTCRQCDDAPCLAVCPVYAISRVENGNKILVIDKEACIGCGKCVSACPFGAIQFDSDAKKAYKCELCGGEPSCVEFCPTEALLFIETESFHAQPKESELESYIFSKGTNVEAFRSSRTRRTSS